MSMRKAVQLGEYKYVQGEAKVSIIFYNCALKVVMELTCEVS